MIQPAIVFLAAIPSASPAASQAALPWYQSPMLGGMLIAGGVILAVYLMMRQFVKAAGRPSQLDRDPAERLADLRHDALRSREPIETLMADAEELTRRLAATLDTKAARLEKLIADADDRLRRLDASARTLDLGDEPEDPEPPVLVAGRIDPAILDRARLDQLGRERGTRERVGDRGGDRTEPAREPVRAASPQTPTPSLHDRVYALADEGRPAVEIARAVNQPIGQVELILNLRSR